ncbi:hypothetical protein DH2020_022533 [Rehmannia glutinosa]|uniref:Uncharacterized protein n=1 Tax=Rehmannia glutinosa TaxID=99300 RepID=A0ABR0WFU0_REHGL
MAIPNKPNANQFFCDRKPWKKVMCINNVVSCIGVDIPTGHRRYSSFQCKAHETIDQIIPSTTRRSGNYPPPVWDFDFIQSLNTEYKEEKYLKRASELIFQVNMMLDQEILNPVQQLELIDDLERLCISYHFEDKINQILNRIYDEDYCKNYQSDLYSTALGFRLLRQHGFSVSQDVFDRFILETGDFDTKEILQLYEASFLLTEGERTLELAKEFATNFLKKKVLEDDEGNIGNIDDEHLSILVHNALDLPHHWRTQRPNARWFIDAYERRPNMKPIVLELAKLDFNIVQATHQDELKHITRWDIEGIDKLPNYMQHCYLALNSFIDEMAYHVLKEQGFLIVPHLRKTWADYCRACLQEAKWISIGYTPKLEEYMNTAWITVSGPVMLTHAFFLVTNPIEKEAVQSLYKYHDIVRYSSTIIRLANDLSTSVEEMKKGDVPKAIECYINETGASREEAREHVTFLIYDTWKKLNEERVANSLLQPEFVRCAFSQARMALLAWWEQSSLAEKLPFARDRLVECYLWTIGGLFEPQYRYSRIMAPKIEKRQEHTLGFDQRDVEKMNEEQVAFSIPTRIFEKFS